MANENMSDWNITLDQFTEQVREEVRKTVDKYLDFLQKTVSSYPLGDTECLSENNLNPMNRL